MGGRKCPTQPKNPEDDGTDGKGFDKSYESVLLWNDIKPSYRSTISFSLEKKMPVGRLFKITGFLESNVTGFHISNDNYKQVCPNTSDCPKKVEEGRDAKGLEML